MSCFIHRDRKSLSLVVFIRVYVEFRTPNLRGSCAEDGMCLVWRQVYPEAPYLCRCMCIRALISLEAQDLLELREVGIY